MTARHVIRRIDYLLVGAVASVLAYSCVTIGTVTRADVPGNPAYYLHRQEAYIAAGSVLLIIAAVINPRWWRRIAWGAYIITLAALGVVLTVAAARGASRWIPIGGFNFQPSEIGKLVLIGTLAMFVAAHSRPQPGRWRVFIQTLAMTVTPAILIFLEPDLGTAAVYLVVAMTILFIAGARWTQMVAILVIVVAAVVLVFRVLPQSGIRVLAPYQESRLTAFLHPGASGRAAYQAQQSLNAIGSGGLAGKGANAAVSKLGYLPEHHTDFIFASVGEQRGFIGTGFLLGLFALIVWRAVRVVTLAATLYESLVAAGIAAMFTTQIFVNVGMTLGIMPTTGIPLPFMTYGGSNTITNLIAVGLLLAIRIRGTMPVPPPLADHELVRADRPGRRASLV